MLSYRIQAPLSLGKRGPQVALALVALWLGACAGAPPPAAAPVAAARYAAVIDAGSSGSRIHVYRWWPGAPLPRVEEAWRLKVGPGLASFSGDPQAVAEHLEPLIAYAWDRITQDRFRIGGEAPKLFLKATGGVRALTEREGREVLAAARAYLEKTPFDLGGVRTIDGRMEGLFGWITVNYLHGRLTGGGGPTVGALDLGGASTQITFEPAEPAREHGVRLELGGKSWHLYSYSYDGLGQDEARQAAASPACFPSGYQISEEEVGAGAYDACRGDVLAFLEAPCEEPPCSLMGIYQPPLNGEMLAFSAFYYATEFFGLTRKFTLRKLEAAGVRYCARPWREIEVAYRERLTWDPYVPRQCFAAAYLVALLHDGYGLAMDDRRVQPVSDIREQGAGWTLGSLLYELAGGNLR